MMHGAPGTVVTVHLSSLSLSLSLSLSQGLALSLLSLKSQRRRSVAYNTMTSKGRRYINQITYLIVHNNDIMTDILMYNLARLR